MNLKLYTFYTEAQYLTGIAHLTNAGVDYYDWGQMPDGLWAVDAFYTGAKLAIVDSYLKFNESNRVVLDYIQLYNDVYQERRLERAGTARNKINPNLIGTI